MRTRVAQCWPFGIVALMYHTAKQTIAPLYASPLQIYQCHVEGCARHGIALFGGLDGSRSSPVVEGCEVIRQPLLPQGHRAATPSWAFEAVYFPRGQGARGAAPLQQRQAGGSTQLPGDLTGRFMPRLPPQVCWNKGHGILVRDGATPAVTDCSVFRNSGYGLFLQDCGGGYGRNLVVENGEGSVATLLLLEGFDAASLAEGNELDRPHTKLTPLRRAGRL